MAEEIPVYWGNRRWSKNGNVLIPGEALAEEDPSWIDYQTIEGNSSGLYSAACETREYRELLHEQVIQQVLSNIEECRDGRVAVLTHGGIAAGKTVLIDLWLEESARVGQPYVRIDFDRVKTQLPEYGFMHDRRIQRAASYVQTESAKLAGTALHRTIKKSANVIYEGSLQNIDQMTQKIRDMRRKKYVIVALSMHCSEEKGQERARRRFELGGRYVPPEIVSETYRNCPSSLVKLLPLVDALLLCDNELDDQPVRPILSTTEGQLAVMAPKLYKQYLQRVGIENRLD
jgi:predicted ABC-type ATPase